MRIKARSVILRTTMSLCVIVVLVQLVAITFYSELSPRGVSNSQRDFAFKYVAVTACCLAIVAIMLVHQKAVYYSCLALAVANILVVGIGTLQYNFTGEPVIAFLAFCAAFPAVWLATGSILMLRYGQAWHAG
jgi:hypothetical protein